SGRTSIAHPLARKSRATRNRRRPGRHRFPGSFFMLLPLFLNLTGRRVVLVGGGPVAAAKLQQLVAAGARVSVVSPEVVEEIARARASSSPENVEIVSREFVPADLDGAWLVVAAATPDVNRSVAQAAEA